VKISIISTLTRGMFVVGTFATINCASSPPLKTEPSTSGIRAAEAVGASNVPRAALHLQLAKEELNQANKLWSSGDKEQGASMLLRAQVDAELALAISREDAERADASAALAKVHELQTGAK
jgi:Domain of unknown function (DUF4398)